MEADHGAPDTENDERFYGIGARPEDWKTSGSRQPSRGTTPRNMNHADAADHGGVAFAPASAAATTGGRGSSKTTPKQHQRIESEDFDDHMLGSAHSPDDICKGCGFPRKSSVWCPVTQRHHGTDEVMPPVGCHRKTSSGSGNAGLKFLKGVFQKVSPQHNSTRHGTSAGNTPEATPRTRAAGLPPLSPSHQPPPGRDDDSVTQEGEVSHHGEAGTAAGAAAGEEGGEGYDPNMQYIQGPDGYYYAYTPGDDAVGETGDADADGADGAEGAEGDGGEGKVQYYCYTDENGETFYYAAELEESMNMKRQQSQSERRTEAGGAAAEAETEAPDAADDNAEDDNRCVYEVKDADGNVVQYVMAVPPLEDVDTAAAQAGTPAEADSPEVTPVKKKKPFGVAFTDFFKPKPKKSKKDKEALKLQQEHVDPNETDGVGRKASTEDEAVLDSLNNRNAHNRSGGDSGEEGVAAPSPAELERLETVDAAVSGFVECLDSSEKKKFDKERKKLVKELELAEKKERDYLVKDRKVFTEDLARERRAELFVLQSEEKTLRRANAKGEPL